MEADQSKPATARSSTETQAPGQATDYCIICLDPGTLSSFINFCGHVFHPGCLGKWWSLCRREDRSTCPYCRKAARDIPYACGHKMPYLLARFVLYWPGDHPADRFTLDCDVCAGRSPQPPPVQPVPDEAPWGGGDDAVPMTIPGSARRIMSPLTFGVSLDLDHSAVVRYNSLLGSLHEDAMRDASPRHNHEA